MQWCQWLKYISERIHIVQKNEKGGKVPLLKVSTPAHKSNEFGNIVQSIRDKINQRTNKISTIASIYSTKEKPFQKKMQLIRKNKIKAKRGFSYPRICANFNKCRAMASFSETLMRKGIHMNRSS